MNVPNAKRRIEAKGNASTNRHSPLPWAVQPDINNGHQRFIVRDAGGRDVAGVTALDSIKSGFGKKADDFSRSIEGQVEGWANATLVVESVNSYSTLRADLAEAVALLQTLMDVAAEAGSDWQTYDFKPRANSASDLARAFLARQEAK